MVASAEDQHAIDKSRQRAYRQAAAVLAPSTPGTSPEEAAAISQQLLEAIQQRKGGTAGRLEAELAPSPGAVPLGELQAQTEAAKEHFDFGPSLSEIEAQNPPPAPGEVITVPD